MMDPRIFLLNQLSLYKSQWLSKPLGIEEDVTMLEKMIQFVTSHPDCFERSCVPGHITSSAVILTEDFSHVLLTHHGKLNLWLQLGGHNDGNPNPHEVALREGLEESGLKDLRIFDTATLFNQAAIAPLFFDVDVHKIPAWKNDPEHEHYDIRYIVLTKEPESIVISEESKDLRWFSLEEAFVIANQRSMHRMFEKIRYLNILRTGERNETHRPHHAS